MKKKSITNNLFHFYIKQFFKSNNGFSLIFSILVISTMLTLVVAAGMRLSMHRNQLDDNFYMNYHISNFNTGLNFAIKLLKEDFQNVDTFNDIWAFSFPPIRIDDNSQFLIKIKPEDSKFNINNLIWGEDNINERLKAQLNDLFFHLNYDSLNPETIIDWIDKDDLPLPGGAESDYYLSNYGYEAKNNFISSLEEIFLIKGFNKIEDTDERDYLLNYITIYGDNRVNINTASETVIRSVSDRIDRQMMFEIMNLRKDYPIQNLDDLLVIPFISQELVNFLKVSFKTTNSIFNVSVTSIVKNVHTKETYFIVERVGNRFNVIHSSLK